MTGLVDSFCTKVGACVFSADLGDGRSVAEPDGELIVRRTGGRYRLPVGRPCLAVIRHAAPLCRSDR